MSTKLKQENIDEAKAAIQKYVNTISAEYQKIDAAINGLCGTDYKGDANDGYLYVYQQIKPMLFEKIAGDESLMAMLKNILDSGVSQMLSPIDPQIGSSNQSAV